VTAYADNAEEAVALANGTSYGLHTASLARAHQVAAQLQAGIVRGNA
jgi:acyl-CoA reductase-like NAD-dependent aldehyde dehydrogenase